MAVKRPPRRNGQPYEDEIKEEDAPMQVEDELKVKAQITTSQDKMRSTASHSMNMSRDESRS